jgi:acetyl-CoA synthetase
VIYTAPTALKMLKHDMKKEDLRGVRNICSVGEALPKTIFEHYKKLGIEINDTYWQSETGAMVIANWKGMKKKIGSIGKTIPGITAKIKDEMMELKADWPSMMTGIYKHDAMYKSYFDKGWFKTNDRATRDKEGYFFFLGRKDDIIKTSGERVSPLEIENILLKHKAVHESAVIGVPDPAKGEIIKAFVVLNKGFIASDSLKEELEMFVKKDYAGHAYPKMIDFVPSLPKTHSGKIMRMLLREQEAKKLKK